MVNVQSVISATNGSKPVPVLRNAKAKAKATTAPAGLSPAEAIQIAFDYGQTMAGQDGTLTNAFATFKANEKVLGDMVQALTEGYFVRKLGYDRAKAKEVIALKKYNQLHPTKNTAENRTKEQETVMSTVRVLVSRAKRMAGITEAPATPAAGKATPAAPKAKANGGTSHPDGNAIDSVDDVNVTMVRFLQTIQAYYKKHATDFADDAGSAWRDWIASAPKVILAK